MRQEKPNRDSDLETLESLVCPRCLGFIPNNATPGAYPGATSRTDDETEVCSECGTEEAMEVFSIGSSTRQSLWPCTRRIPNPNAEKVFTAKPKKFSNIDELKAALHARLRSMEPGDFD